MNQSEQGFGTHENESWDFVIQLHGIPRGVAPCYMDAELHELDALNARLSSIKSHP